MCQEVSPLRAELQLHRLLVLTSEHLAGFDAIAHLDCDLAERGSYRKVEGDGGCRLRGCRQTLAAEVERARRQARSREGYQCQEQPDRQLALADYTRSA